MNNQEKEIVSEINIGIDYANPNRVWDNIDKLIKLKTKDKCQESTLSALAIKDSLDKSFFGTFESALKNGYKMDKHYVIVDWVLFHDLLNKEKLKQENKSKDDFRQLRKESCDELMKESNGDYNKAMRILDKLDGEQENKCKGCGKFQRGVDCGSCDSNGNLVLCEDCRNQDLSAPDKKSEQKENK